MALKNRDGSEFKLNKPNPIMAVQSIWKKEDKLIFHNKIGKFVVIPDQNQIPSIIPEIKEPVIVQTLEEPEVVGNDKTQVWCLPASNKEYKDAMYGEKYHKIRYGNKFLFEAVILNQEDLSINLWTNTKAITQSSILFPRTHDKRWWCVQSIQEQDDGYVIFAVISDYQPKFSD